MDSLTDKELIDLYLRGGDAGFEALYQRYRRRLYWYLNEFLPSNPAEVDDVFQQTWLRVIDKLPKYRDDGHFSAWLFRIGRNLAIDRLRRLKSSGAAAAVNLDDAPEPEAPPGVEPWREMDSDELAAVLETALAALPPEQREVFELRRQEFSFKEIAEIQDCSVNTALGRMQYALRKLRNLIRNTDRGGLL